MTDEDAMRVSQLGNRRGQLLRQLEATTAELQTAVRDAYFTGGARKAELIRAARVSPVTVDKWTTGRA